MANQIIWQSEKFKVGDLVSVHHLSKEGGKEKTQIFEGRVIAVHGRKPNTTFTVRKIGADNIGVEKIFPLYSPLLSKIVLKKSFPVRRAKLYYLRRKK